MSFWMTRYRKLSSSKLSGDTQIRFMRWVLEGGTENRWLLQWVMSMAEYNARPQCVVLRDWLQLALKTLGKYLAPLSDRSLFIMLGEGISGGEIAKRLIIWNLSCCL